MARQKQSAVGEGGAAANETDVRATARLTVKLPARIWDVLEATVREDGITRTEALRRAISVENYVRQRIRAGDQIVVRHANGTENEVVFPFY